MTICFVRVKIFAVKNAKFHFLTYAESLDRDKPCSSAPPTSDRNNSSEMHAVLAPADLWRLMQYLVQAPVVAVHHLRLDTWAVTVAFGRCRRRRRRRQLLLRQEWRNVAATFRRPSEAVAMPRRGHDRVCRCLFFPLLRCEADPPRLTSRAAIVHSSSCMHGDKPDACSSLFFPSLVCGADSESWIAKSANI